MIQKPLVIPFKLILVATLFSIFLALFSFAKVSAAADIQSSTCQGAELQFSSAAPTGQECKFNNSKPEAKLNALIAQVVNIFSVIVGVVAVIMIIVGGFKYITSGGDSGNVTGAKNTILYAVVGLIIVALSQFIVKFVLSKAASAGS